MVSFGYKIPVKVRDGSVGYCRQNGINLYLLASAETYNEHFYAFYVVELLFVITAVIFLVIFDILVVNIT